MSPQNRPELLVIGVGGLGRCMVNEALARGQSVSVLVRNRDKLESQLGTDAVAELATINIGDATEPTTLDTALEGIDVVLSGRGADPTMARELAEASSRNEVRKICWPAGTTNVLADDGVTPNYKTLEANWPVAEQVYKTHKQCIDAIADSGVNYVFFCPGKMGPAGSRSDDIESTIRVNRDAGPFVSYEDAAWVMVEAALSTTYDRQKVSASSPKHQ